MDISSLKIEISKDEKYKDLLKECYDYASKSNHPSTHTAALLVKDGKVILRGKNVLPEGVKKLKEREIWSSWLILSNTFFIEKTTAKTSPNPLNQNTSSKHS